MTQNEDNLVLANKIEQIVSNPEETAKCVQKKIGGKPGVFSVIRDFVKSYNEKDLNISDEAWLAGEFEKPEYSNDFANQRERLDAAKGIVQGVEDYENAKKFLHSHIHDLQGSCLARQINIGAANNNADPAPYADDVAAGLNDAAEENAALVLDDEEAE
jgi:hypothetical protein